MVKTTAVKTEKGHFLKSILKGSLVALSISLILICIFAFLLRFFDISTDLIRPINQIIKIVSVLIGSFVSLKSVNEMGLITGFIIGVLYTIISFLVFSLLNGSLSINASLVNDLLFGGLAGAISGVIAVNIFGRKK